MLVNEIKVEDLSVSSIFQSEFWAKVKAPLWHPFAFSFSSGEKKSEVLVLVRTFIQLFSIAYIPFGPECKLDKTELYELSLSLKKKLPQSVILLRFDLPYLSEFEVVKPFHVCKESVQADATVIIKLDEDFSLHTRAKRNIAKTKEVFTVELATEDEIEAWHSAYVETGERDGFQTRSLSYIKKLMRFDTKTVKPLLYLAKQGGKVMGGILNLRGQDTELYLFGATLKSEDNLSPGYLLQYTAMSKAKDAGLKYYDMFGIEGKEGRGEHLKSLTLFKTAFGGARYYRTPTFDFYYKGLFARAYRLMENLRYSIYRKKQ